MKKLKLLIAVFLVFSVLFAAGCQSEKVDESEEYLKVNEKIVEYFYRYYLWEDMLPGQVTIPSTDPFDFFKELRSYAPDDEKNKWSVLARSRDEFYASVGNSGKSFGYSLVFYQFTDMDNEIWAVVQYVHPGTPADNAGIKRGNLISRIDGEPMTDGGPNDFRNLVYADRLTVTVHESIQDETGREVNIQSVKGYLDPILDSKIIARGGRKIAYLMYTDYVLDSENDLSALFGGFKAAGVTDLILDLRYNGGGYSSTALHIASLIAPSEVLDGTNIFSQFTYNDVIGSRSVFRYPKKADVPGNLDLDRVFILTSRSTASASEQTIIGLDPYMEVITIGTDSHGKFVGGSVYPSSSDKNDMYGWGMYLITFWYVNSEGKPGVNTGLAPDYEVKEDWRSYKPIGDELDPLIAKAINLIAGEPEPESVSPAPPFGAKEIWSSRPGIETGTLIYNTGTAELFESK